MPVPICAVTSTVLSTQAAPTSWMLQEPGCTVQYKGAELGTGKLHVTEEDIAWIRDDSMGFRLNYKRLIAHAISKDPASYPRPCLYMLYDGTTPTPQQGESREGSDEETEDEGNIEIRIAPSDENNVKRLYEAVSDGQLLNPEEQSDDSDEDCQGGMVGMGTTDQLRFVSDSQVQFDADGQVILNQNEDTRRFEDMDED